MKKRLLSALLVVCMVMTMTPTVFAVDGASISLNETKVTPVSVGDEQSLLSAIDGATGETTIQLSASVTVNNTITIAKDKNIVLDLNNCNLSAAANGTNVINNSGILTVKNGTVAAFDASDKTDGMAIINEIGASLTINQDEGMTTKLIGRSAIKNSGNVVVNGGTIESYNRNVYWGTSGSTITINDGTFTSPNGSSGYGRVISSEGNVTIHGGTFYAGGTSGNGDNYMNAIAIFNGATLIVEPAVGKNVSVTSETDYAVSSVSGGKVYIKGGTFACNGSRADVLILKKTEASLIEISGGTFKHKPYDEYLASGHITLEEGGNYLVKLVNAPADVTVNSYDELNTALSGSILDPKNITLGAEMTIPANADLNLQRGYTLTVPSGITLTVDGILRLNGTMTNSGTLTVGERGFIEHPLRLSNQGTITDLPQDMSASYIISTPMQLQWLSYMVEQGNFPTNTQLSSDLAMPANVTFTPIGNSETHAYVNANFDGCNHIIRNLNVLVTTEYKGGMFGFVSNGSIKNLTITGTNTNSTSSYIGALVGCISGNYIVQNVNIKDYAVESPISYGVGGFVGKIESATSDRVEFIGCTTENINVSGYANVGGIWGTSTGAKGTIGIYNCSLNGTVNAINVNEGICGGYGASALVEIIGLDKTKLTVTGSTSDVFVAYTSTNANTQPNADASQFKAFKNEKGTWEAKSVNDLAAMVGGNVYIDLPSAITAAKDGDTVTMLKVYEGEPIVIGKSINIDLGATGTSETLFTADNQYQKSVNGTILVFSPKTFTITFQTNGGSDVTSQTVVYNGKVTKPVDPTRSGYTFAGWYADETLSTTYDFNTPVTDVLTLYAKWNLIPTGGGSSSGGSSSGGSTGGSSGGSISGGNVETTVNPNGSTTTTVTKPDGSKTETTKNPDGSKEVVETQKDGTTTTTTTDKVGNKTEIVEKIDGSSTTKVENKDGSSSTTTVSMDGKAETTVTLPHSVVNEAKGNAVQLPMPETKVTKDVEKAPTVTVDLPVVEKTKIEVPVKDVTAGTVAILVKADGTEEVIKTTVESEKGIIVALADGDTIKIVDNSKNFTDVSDEFWGTKAIDFATSRELFNGTGETTFSPNNSMNRAMIVTVLARLDGVDTTKDANWYESGRKWAIENGISDGTSMMNNLTREQLVSMLWRYAGNPTSQKSLNEFKDAGSISNYAQEAFSWAVEQGIINGKTFDTLHPNGEATRTEVATILMRFCQNIAK